MSHDPAYLLDMLVAARMIQRFTSGITREIFMQDELLQNAVMRPLEIIGEAARNVSQETRDAHPEIPWHEMIGMRNRLIHEYFRVKLPIVWGTVQNDIPHLITVLEPLVPPSPGDSASS